MYNGFNKHRKFVMGIAVLLIVFLHTSFRFPFILHYIRRLGYVQVDTFMMLSGYGLYYSLSKTTDLYGYIKKRWLRIYPSYFLFAIVFLIYKVNVTSIVFSNAVGIVTGLSYWACQKYAFSWFGETIMLFYIIAPFLYAIVKHSKRKWHIILASVILVIPFVTNGRFMLPVSRIISFTTGFIFADYYNARLFMHKELQEKKLPWFCLGMVGCFLLLLIRNYLTPYLNQRFDNDYHLIFIVSSMIVPSMIILFSNLADFLLRYKFGCKVYNWVEKIGTATFEIYLFQSLFYIVLNTFFLNNIEVNNYIYICMYTTSIIIGYLIKTVLIDRIYMKLV